MKIKELFEALNYDLAEQFLIASWGRVLYLDYENLSTGSNHAAAGSKYHGEFLNAASDYMRAWKSLSQDDDDMVELDEWVGEGAPLKGGIQLVNKTVVDYVFDQAARALSKPMTVHRFDHTPTKIRRGTWISTTKGTQKYNDSKASYELQPGDRVIDCLNFADEHEIIVSSDLLIKRTT